jgi:hypothetical protein
MAAIEKSSRSDERIDPRECRDCPSSRDFSGQLPPVLVDAREID